MAKSPALIKRYRKKISQLQKDHFLHLSALTFLLVFTTVLATHRKFNQYENVRVKVQPRVKGVQIEALPKGLPEIPVVNEDVVFPVLSAQSVIVLDMDSGVPLFEKNPNARFLPASTTKIMTALVALESYELEQEFVVERFSVPGQKMNLLPGEKISVRNLIYGLLIHSANDAAEVLARNFPGGREVFVQRMNTKAEELKLHNTHFENPSGLDGIEHFSTARDLVSVAAHAMKDPFFAQVVSTERKLVTDASGEVRHNLNNINELLGDVDGVLGVKTGWTENARENLVTYLERDGKKIMLAVMGSQDRFGETKTLIDWVFDNYRWVPIESYSP